MKLNEVKNNNSATDIIGNKIKIKCIDCKRLINLNDIFYKTGNFNEYYICKICHSKNKGDK